MKKAFFALPLLLILLSCSTDDSAINGEYVFVPIASVELPERFINGNSYDIEFTYTRPSSCHTFAAVQQELDGEMVKIGVVNLYREAKSCENEELSVEGSFRFVAGNQEFYIFKFWQGFDENGESTYLTIEVPVTNSA